MNDTTEGETEEKTHRHYSRKWIYLGIKKDGNAISRGQALLHMIAWKFIIQKHTKSAIDGIPPKKINTGNIWKQILYTEHQTSDKDIKCNTIQNRK